jgi:hypothetical protein
MTATITAGALDGRVAVAARIRENGGTAFAVPTDITDRAQVLAAANGELIDLRARMTKWEALTRD